MNGMRKTEFWWASVHGADPEPVERVAVDGREGVLTIGCADPFWLDEDPCPVMFVDEDPMYRPRHPDKVAAERAAIKEAENRGRKTYQFEGKRLPLPHGWRGPR
jgi:hypothetical protein